MNPLHPPLVVVEKDDEEFFFFASTDEVLDDRHDVLWGDEYDGWDSSGQFFSLVRREVPRRWWHKLFAADATKLSIEGVQVGHRVSETEERLRRYLKNSGLGFADLLAAGLQREKELDPRLLLRRSANGTPVE